MELAHSKDVHPSSQLASNKLIIEDKTFFINTKLCKTLELILSCHSSSFYDSLNSFWHVFQ